MKPRSVLTRSLATLTLVTGCQSSPFPGLVAVKDVSLRPPLFDVWQSQCLANGEGSFLSSLRTPQMPGLQFEGRWSAQFTRFQGRVANPLNHSLVNIELTPQNQTLSVSPELGQLTPEVSESIQKSVHALAVLGPIGMRKMLCGIIGFSEPGTKFFSAEAASPEARYGFLNRVLFEGHRVDITARYQQQGDQMVSNIHLKAPVVIDTPELTLDWRGRAQPLKPLELDFIGKDLSMHLQIEDFE